MNKALLIIDVQNDFVTGSLGSEYARDVVVPNILKLASEFDPRDIFTTLDTHTEDYLNTQEGKKLPIKHCIVNTDGCDLIPEIENLIKGENFFHKIHKETFGIDRDFILDVLDYCDEIHICGLVTDICVISNALIIKSTLPEIRIVVHENCCGGTSKEAHDAAILVMKSCQIDIE